MRIAVTVAGVREHAVNVLVDVGSELTISDLAAALAAALRFPVQIPQLWIGDRLLAPATPIADSGLLEGSIVSFAKGLVSARQPSSGLWLHTVGGPDAGRVLSIGRGKTVIGRVGAIRINDSSVSRQHASLSIDPAGITLTDLRSRNGSFLEGERVNSSVPVTERQLIELGDTPIELCQAFPPDGAVEHRVDGRLDYNRPPRLQPESKRTRVVLPAEPTASTRRPIPVIAILAPLVLGVVIAIVAKNPTFVLFCVMTPVLAVGNVVSDRRSGAKSSRARREQYERDLVLAKAKLETALLADRANRRDAHPDPAKTLLTALGPDRRLWDRRRVDEDFLAVRVGLGDLPAEVLVEVQGGAPTGEMNLLHGVPVVLPLLEIGVIGIAGPSAETASTARWLLGQLAVRHSPRDLSFVLLTDGADPEDWDWFGWLPHARLDVPDAAVAQIGNDSDTATARISELTALVKARRDTARSQGSAGRSSFPAVIVILWGARSLRMLPGLIDVLRDGPDVGVFALCFDRDQRLLPQECSAVITAAADDPEIAVGRHRGEAFARVLADRVAASWADTVARSLAPLRDASPEGGDAALPESARLLDVLSLDPPTPVRIQTGWRTGGRSTRAVIGVGLDGPFALDLSRDGPHGLIAGTTGSGKSELLQTIVAALALENRPDEMTFVLVDYKGGSAFKDCVRLPHTVGMVTDLDTHLVERALVSLTAELRRREHQLAGVGAKDIEEYTRQRGRTGTLAELPRLVLVIDEFASLVRELPDFVTGLVNIAQRGRSLGIHLLLATQRPSGAVSPEIRANTNLRIALRMTDAAESIDVLDAPDAARISKATPGRAFVRLAHGSLGAFQAARVGGRQPGKRSVTFEPPFIAELGWGRLGYTAPAAKKLGSESEETTDLAALVEAIAGAAREMDLPAQPSPWLPALEETLLLDDLAPSTQEISDIAPVPYGLEDLPEQQSQHAAVFDFATAGHLFAVGAPRSGRSQLMRTLAGSIAERTTSSDVHIYGLDCGNGALQPFTELPHCGAVVSRTQVERAARLIGRLIAELEHRQAVLSESGFADLTEQRASAAAGDRLPRIVLMLDRWEGFTNSLGEIDGGRLSDAILRMLREGASVGIHLIISGDRSLATGRIGTLTEDKLGFRLADRGDYTQLGLNPRQLPDSIPPGRAFRAESGTETHIAVLSRDLSGQGQAAALAEIGGRARERDVTVPRERRPFRVDVLPSRLTFEQAWPMRASDAPMFGLVGVGGDELVGAGPDLGQTPTFVVAGPPKSGRSTVLLTMARSLLTAGSALVIAAPRPSPLRGLEGTSGVTTLFTGADIDPDELAAALARRGEQPFVVLLDDAEAYKTCAASESLRAIVKGSAGTGLAVVVGGNAEDICTGLSGWQVDAKKGRAGALLSPQGLSDGDLIGVRVPRSSIGAPVAPGRAIIHLGDGALHTVQVPMTTVS